MLSNRLRRAQSLLEVTIVIALVALVVLAILGSLGVSLTGALSSATCSLTGGTNCSSPQPSPTPTAGITILVTPASASLAVGQSQAFTAIAYGPTNNLIGDVTSSTTFSINPDGSCSGSLCTATLAGTHNVTAHYGSDTQHVVLSFTPLAASSLRLSPTSVSLPSGSSQTYVVTSIDSYGNALGDVTSSATLTISSGGSCNNSTHACTAPVAGTYQINATAAGHSSTTPALLTILSGALANITLSPSSSTIAAGASQTYTATGFDANGNVTADVTSSSTFAILPDGSCTLAVCTASAPGDHQVTAVYFTHTAISTLTITTATIASISILPTTATLAAGVSQSYTVTGFDAFSNSLGDFTSSTVFTISPDGTCTLNACSATTLSTHTVTATYASLTADATFTVTPGSLGVLLLSPSDANVFAGVSRTYTSAGFDAYGNSLGDITSSTAFTISPNGSCSVATCSASTAGAHTVTGTSLSLSATATLTVAVGALHSLALAPDNSIIAAAATQTYVVTGLDFYNNSLGDVTSSSTLSIAPDGSCNNSLHTCTAATAGSHTVTATDSTFTTSSTLIVEAAGLSSITISPSSASIVAGTSQAYTATGFDAFGNPTGDVTFATTFSLTPNGSCTLAACTASTVGDHIVTGANSSHAATATLAITTAAIASITLGAPSSTLIAGDSQNYTANGFDAFSNPLGDVTAQTTFTIAAEGSCTLNACTATSAGGHIITGTNSGHTANVFTAIIPAGLFSLTLSPSSASVIAGQAQNFSATGFDFYGNSRGDVTSSATFTLAPDGSCTSNACTASTVGLHTVTASLSSHSVTAGLTVTASSLASITLTPASSAIAAGGNQVYTVTSFDAFGNPLGDATSSTIFVITPNGSCTLASCTASIPGTHTVTGTDSGQTATATLNVSAGAPSSITIAPASASVSVGAVQTYTAQGFDAFNNSTGDVTPFTVFILSPNGSCNGADCTATVPGVHTVSGNDSGHSATATLTVTSGALASITIAPSSATVSAGSNQTYTATGFDTYNNSLGTVAAAYTIAPDGSCTNAVCTASAAGSHTVTGTDSGHTATATLSVTATTLANITISPSSSSIAANASQTYTATSFDSFGNTIGDATLATTFTILPNGSCALAACTATLAGDHTVTGNDASHTSTSILTVVHGPLDHLSLTPSSSSVSAGSSQTYSVTGLDFYNNTLGDVTAATSFAISPNGSCNSGLASCSATTAGGHTVTATDATKTGTASLSFSATTLASITIAPPTASLIAGTTQAYTATGFDAFGNTLGFVTSDTTFVVTTNAGSCTLAVCGPTTVGTQTITGTNAGHTATATVTVSAAGLSSITINTLTPNINADQTATYTAAGFDPYGNSLGDLTSSTTFTNNGSIACVGASCTSHTPGTFTVTGAHAGVSNVTSTLTVTAGAITKLALTLTPASITATGTTTVTAFNQDQFSNNVSSQTLTVLTISPTSGSSCPSLSTCTTTVASNHTITGTGGGHSATATLTVAAGPVFTLTISPLTANITSGGAGQAYTATALDASGNTLGDVTLTTVFTTTGISGGACPSHVCSPTLAGSQTVTGTNNSRTATATVTVTANPTVNSITIALSPTTVLSGSATVATATGFDVYNNLIGTVGGTTYVFTAGTGTCEGSACVPTNANNGTFTIQGTNNGHTTTATLTVTPVINTVAGNGTATFAGDSGLATNASLNGPSGVAVDGSGNIYIADTTNNRIRKVTIAGIITTVAGSANIPLGDGGLATSASLSGPRGVAVDSSGNIYIADTGNNRIRKFTVGGNISTVAGSANIPLGDGGLATSASLNGPRSVAFDSSGNIYIADAGNNRIRKVTASTGIITTVAGNGTATFAGDGAAATSASLSSPSGVAFDSSGNIYIADANNNRIRKVTVSTGFISTVTGGASTGSTGDGGLATSALINHPIGIAVDISGNIYFATAGDSRIRKVTVSSGFISTVAGNGAGFTPPGDGAAATSAKVSNPWGIALDSSGNIYIADNANSRIRKVG